MGRQNGNNLATTSTRVTRSHAPIVDLTEDNLTSNPQPTITAPTQEKRVRKRKADQGNDDGELAAAEPKPTSAKAKGKGKAKVEPTPAKESSPKKQKQDVPEEKRLSKWRAQPTQKLRDRLHRCLTQRMVVLDRERNMECYPPEETFKIAGSTGNVYQVHIANKPNCNCPDGIKVRTSLMEIL